jgi:peroxiredoxin
MLCTILMRGGLRVASAFLVVAAATTLPLAARAQPSRTPPPTKPAPSSGTSTTNQASPQSMAFGRFLVGDPAPAIRLNDHTGKPFDLTLERRNKPWLIVFIRQLSELPDIDAVATDLSGLGIGSAVIAPFGHERVKQVVRKPQLPVLFDRASMTARTYGVFDPVTGNPRPGAFLVDVRGRIVWFISGGLPRGGELVRMTREALEASDQAATSEGGAN